MDENNKQNKWKVFLRYAIVVLTTVVVTLVGVFFLTGGGSEAYLKSLIKTYYVDPVDDQRLAEGCKAGMLASLGDRNTFFISSEVGYDLFEEDSIGEFGGIGATLTLNKEYNNVVIVSVMPGTPAEKAGLQPGDLILSVDGENVEGQSTDVVVSKVRGIVGESVSLGIRRNEAEQTVDVVRAVIHSVTVTSKMLENNIGYLAVSEFDLDTDVEMKQALENMAETDGVILDFRNNPGGIMEAAINCVDLFLAEGKPIVSARYKGDHEVLEQSKTDAFYTKPVVVLVNENSASASEIFSAAMKENGRAAIVGTNTYGKGTIQRTFKLPNNEGAHITIGRFYSPNGNQINQVGVSPDVSVDLPEELKDRMVSQLAPEQDVQLAAALRLLVKE